MSVSTIPDRNSSSGFTLIEVIVTLVIASILAVIVFTFMNTGVTKSGMPVIWTKHEYELSEVMDKVTADYRNAVGNPSFDLSSFKSQIEEKYRSYISVEYTDFAFTGTDYEESGTNPNILKVTLVKDEHSLMALFTH
ncbi:MAG TPA: prepilin-type N-terminal cleavage/methylation domain-containing protein [Syntrophales bacterium]|nr:prepilin-type N-terminal cleavage/methylation domain-containing protein [Syntrophales bacterium]HPQ42883.1 prepilin-type N-terminal cleavage/methylation domain-containing protein [Syntrophales bacterium]